MDLEEIAKMLIEESQEEIPKQVFKILVKGAFEFIYRKAKERKRK